VRAVETLGRAFAGSLIGMAVIDLDGRWVEVNDALCRMLGRTREELVGRAVLEFTHPDDLPASTDRLRVLGAGGDRMVFEKRYLRPDGTVVHTRVLSSVAHGPDGQPEAIFSQLEDVTDRREAEALLRTVDEPFARLFDDAPVGMTINSVLPGDDGRVLRVNDAFCRMLRAPADAIVGALPATYLHPDEHAAGVEDWDGLLSGRFATVARDRRYVRADGTTFVGRNIASVVRDVNGGALYVVCQIQDVTEIWEAERRFRTAFEEAPIGMALTGVQQSDAGRPLRVNAALCRILRVAPSELMARNAADFVAPDRREDLRAAWLDLLRGRRPAYQDEMELHRDDGTTVWVELSASLVRDGDGSPLYVLTHVADVDARKRGERLLREAERRFRSAFEDSSVAMALYDVDLVICQVNAALSRLTGHDEAQLVGRPMLDLIDHDDALSRDDVYALLRGEAGDVRELRCRRADGALLWTHLTASPVRDDEGRPRHYVAQLEDVTAERAARRAAELRLAQQTAAAWLGQRALTEDDLGAVLDAAVNVVAATCQVEHAAIAAREGDGGLRMVATVGWPWRGVLVDETAATSQVAYTIDARTPVIVEDVAAETRFSTEILRAHGVASGMSVPIAGEGDDDLPYGALSVHSSHRRAFSTDDIAFLTSVATILTGCIRRFAAARNLRHQSLHDPLTHLPNRALLLDRLRHAMARSRRDGSTLAVLFCDLDDFKHVNDTLGHEAGDRLLRTLAPRVRGALRAIDTLARFGGDEFVVLCEGLSDPSEVLAVADRLLDAFAEPVDLGPTRFVPTASIGIALAGPETCSDPEALLRDADVAMYRAKSRGKGRYEMFDAAMRTQTLEHVGLLADLRGAVARGQLVLEYQPIVSLRRHEFAGVEALVRWRHPERGLLGPDQFIGLATDSGIIHELGRWVIDEAVRQAADWKRRGVNVLERVMVGVNVSWRQVAQGTLVDDVREALARHRLDASGFCVEVTETALLEDPGRAAEVLVALRELGVHLVLDDFGTGQSSLSVLRDFPFHTLKLDRSFLIAGDWAIVRAVTQMARSFDLLVVAEGIERPDQEMAAAEFDCDFGQGWHYGRAALPAELERSAPALAARLLA
jgi:diguanylate cyclase (GGDEF)-like protein/PAS domain S-box-containing protein